MQHHRKYSHIFFNEIEHNDKKYELGVFTGQPWQGFFLTCYDTSADEFTHLEQFDTKRAVKAQAKKMLREQFAGSTQQIILNPSFIQ